MTKYFFFVYGPAKVTPFNPIQNPREVVTTFIQMQAMLKCNTVTHNMAAYTPITLKFKSK